MAATDAQTSLRMPEDLHRDLSAAANAAGHSLGAEIRHRLVQSFATAADTQTSQLLMQIATATKLLEQYFVGRKWHADPRSFAIFTVAVNILIERHKPAETAAGDEDAGAMFSGDPEEAGARLAILVDITTL